ncbi:hypothetical protein G6F59_013297 [Rhizopus arrhizus]|nr:hypothetical protein G6F59_013297 [Rhizopus arrhizus]
MARIPLRDAVTITADALRGHDLAGGAFVTAVARLKRLRIVDAPGALEQRRLRARGGVEHLGTRRVQRGQRAPGLREIVVAMLAREIVARIAVGVGGDQVEAIPMAGGGDVEELVAGSAAVGARRSTVRRQVVGAGVGQATTHSHAEIAAFAQHVTDLQRLHLDHAADAARGVGLQAGALGDGQAGDQVRVQVGALRLACIATVGVDAGLAAVDDHRHAALALDAADVDVEAVADARIAGGDTGHALDDVAVGCAAEALQVRAVERGGGADAAVAVEQAGFVAGRAGIDTVAGHAQRVGDDHAIAGLRWRRCFQRDCIGADPAYRQATALQQPLQRVVGRQAATTWMPDWRM